jgi:hypothetical protein
MSGVQIPCLKPGAVSRLAGGSHIGEGSSLSTVTRLYFEAHITVEASPVHHWDSFAARARLEEWRASKFDEDEVDDMSGQWFLSARSPRLETIKASMLRMLGLLRDAGLTVLRFKIEDTVLDSKYGDTEQSLVA